MGSSALSKIEVGTRVRLTKAAVEKWKNYTGNPRSTDVVGTTIEPIFMGYRVEWDNGMTIGYEEGDLEVVHEPKEWGKLSDAEKGALLLAHHRREAIEYYGTDDAWHVVTLPSWLNNMIYRVKPKPVKAQSELYWGLGYGATTRRDVKDTHKLFIDTVDGEIENITWTKL